MPIPPSNTVLQVLGTFILWIGWYGFNGGSALSIFGGQYGRDIARVCITTTLSTAASGITAVVTHYMTTNIQDVTAMVNGVLSGLVSITAGCSVVDPWAAIIIGAVGGAVYKMADVLLERFKIDDPLNAFPVHGACGIWGVIAVGIFCRPEYTYNLQGRFGLVFGGDLILPQLIFIFSLFAWVLLLSVFLFTTLKRMNKLRVSEITEEIGADVAKHGGRAYNLPGAHDGRQNSFRASLPGVGRSAWKAKMARRASKDFSEMSNTGKSLQRTGSNRSTNSNGSKVSGASYV